MKNFEYVIKDNLGIHARPAGVIIKEAAKYTSTITVSKGEKSVDGKKLFALMSLAVKHGETIAFAIEGEDEEAAYEGIKALIETTL